MREAALTRPAPCDRQPLTLKMVSESRVTWATTVPILVFLVLSILDLGPMYTHTHNFIHLSRQHNYI